MGSLFSSTKKEDAPPAEGGASAQPAEGGADSQPATGGGGSQPGGAAKTYAEALASGPAESDPNAADGAPADSNAPVAEDDTNAQSE